MRSMRWSCSTTLLSYLISLSLQPSRAMPVSKRKWIPRAVDRVCLSDASSSPTDLTAMSISAGRSGFGIDTGRIQQCRDRHSEPRRTQP